MKHTIFLVLLLTVGSHAQTLDATVRYLNDALKTAGTIHITDSGTATLEPSIDGCSASWTLTYVVEGIRPTTTNRISFSLGKVSSASVDGSILILQSEHPDFRTQLVSNGAPTTFKDASKLTLRIAKDQESAGRIVRAFTRASALCRE